MISTHSSDMQRSFLLFLLFLSQIIVESFVTVSGLFNPVVNYANADISKGNHINHDYIGGYRTRTNNEGERQLQGLLFFNSNSFCVQLRFAIDIQSKTDKQKYLF